VCVIPESLGPVLEGDREPGQDGDADSFGEVWSYVCHPWPANLASREEALRDGYFPLTATSFQVIKALETEAKPVLVVFLSAEASGLESADDESHRAVANLRSALIHNGHRVIQWRPRWRGGRLDQARQLDTDKPVFSVAGESTESNSLDCIKAFLLRDEVGLSHPQARRHPFKFLDCYDVPDHPVLVGRERWIRRIRESLTQENDSPGAANARCLHLVGPSGVGKSSLLRAGVVGELFYRAVAEHPYVVATPSELVPTQRDHAGLLGPASEAIDESEEQQRGWRGLDRFARRCRNAVLALVAEGEEAGETVSSPGALVDATAFARELSDLIAQKLGDDARLIVALDQVEELLEDSARPGGEQRWQPFLAFFDAMLTDPRFVLLTAENTARPGAEQGGGEVKADIDFLARVRSRRDALPVGSPEAIDDDPATFVRQIFAKCGLAIDDALVCDMEERVRGFVSEDDGWRHLALPSVSLTLSRLEANYRRNIAPIKSLFPDKDSDPCRITYDDVDNVEIKLADRIDAVGDHATAGVEIDRFCPETIKQQRQRALRHVLLPLVALWSSFRGDEWPYVARRRVAALPVNDVQAPQLFKYLFDYGLISQAAHGDQPLYSLAHESVVSGWHKARAELEAALDDLSLAKRLLERVHAAIEEGVLPPMPTDRPLFTWIAECRGPRTSLLAQVPEADRERMARLFVAWLPLLAPEREDDIDGSPDAQLWAVLVGAIEEAMSQETTPQWLDRDRVAVTAQAAGRSRRGLDPPEAGDTKALNAAAYYGDQATMVLMIEHLAVRPSEEDPQTGDFPLLVASHAGQLNLVWYLLEAGALPDQVNAQSGDFPLFCAVEAGHAAVVECLLEAGASPDQSHSERGYRPLSLAARKGLANIAGQLLAAGASADQYDSESGKFPLQSAAESGHAVVIRQLVEAGAPVSAVDNSSGRFPLLGAASNGHTAAVEELLAVGASAEQTNPESGRSPLIWAAEKGHTSVVDSLLRAGASPEQENPQNEEFALLCAAQSGHAEVAEQLLAEGAAPDKENMETGAFPLFVAVHNGHEAVAAKLLAAGADADELHLDSGTYPITVAAYKGYAGIAERLLAAGASPDNNGSNGLVCPLLIAARRGHAGVVNRLLLAGANPDPVYEDDELFPLLVAGQNGYPAVVQELLEAGASVNRIDEESGTSPLVMAALEGAYEVAVSLLEAGAEVEPPPGSPGAMSAAQTQGHQDIVELLKQNNAG
jgi:ankyrin repeat protein